MGMSIDETIEILHGRDKCMEYVTDNDSEAFEMAIDTMRKYQEITEILKDDNYYEEYGNNAEKFIVSAISEVLENGNEGKRH